LIRPKQGGDRTANEKKKRKKKKSEAYNLRGKVNFIEGKVENENQQAQGKKKYSVARSTGH